MQPRVRQPCRARPRRRRHDPTRRRDLRPVRRFVAPGQRERGVVAGGGTGDAHIYDAKTAALIRTYNLGTQPSFINDVAVTPDAAYFTDSQKNVLYRVPIGPTGALGDAQTITLGGDYAHVAGQFNLNGIDAAPSGNALVAVQSVNRGPKTQRYVGCPPPRAVRPRRVSGGLPSVTENVGQRDAAAWGWATAAMRASATASPAACAAECVP